MNNDLGVEGLKKSYLEPRVKCNECSVVYKSELYGLWHDIGLRHFDDNNN